MKNNNGKSNGKTNLAMVKLPVSFLKEGNKFIAYTPALDISTCGDTFSQAKKRFEQLVRIFLKETIKMGTLEDVLRDCGWRKITHPTHRWIPPIVIGQEEQAIQIPIKG